MEDDVLKLAQKCLSEVPVIVLGSGASLKYGVGGMAELGEHLAKNVAPTQADEATTWGNFIADLNAKGDLEGALTHVSLPPALETLVVNETRAMVLRDDQAVFVSQSRDSVLIAPRSTFGMNGPQTRSAVPFLMPCKPGASKVWNDRYERGNPSTGRPIRCGVETQH